MNLFEAIYCRKSVRNFIMESLDQDLLNCIKNYYEKLNGLISGVGIDFKIIDNIVENRKISGLFSIKAPYYLLISSEVKPEYLLNVGYLMEHISLYLTTKNIGSCFLGSARPNTKETFGMRYEYVIMLAFGKSNESIYRDSMKAKRLSMDEVCVYKSDPTNNIKTMIKSAILAPSSVNNQPWRFVVYDNRIHVFCKKGIVSNKALEDMKNIDIGIMVANLVIAAEELWSDVSVKRLDNITHKNVKNNYYITSILINK